MGGYPTLPGQHRRRARTDARSGRSGSASLEPPIREPDILSSRQLDESRWGVIIAFESHGTRALVRVDDPELEDEVKARLPYGWQPAIPHDDESLFSLLTSQTVSDTRMENWYSVYAPDGVALQTRDLGHALDELETRMQIHVAEMAHDRVFLHAGAVGLRGRAIILPGQSFAGKTTLVHEFLRAGAQYYSDEYAVLDARGVVYPFARPLGIRVDGGSQKKYLPQTLGAVSGTEPIPVGLVLLCSYRGRARWRPERLSPGQGLLQLLGNAVPARRKPQAVIETLEAVVSNAPVFRGERGEARLAVLRTIDLLEY